MTARNKNVIIEKAIAGGIAGAALGALLTGKKNNTLVSAIVGAAIGASLQAIKEAEDINVPVMYEEDGIVYRVHSGGKREVVKTIERSTKDIPQTFTLG